MSAVRGLVLDTHIWLDWLVFRDPRIEPLKAPERYRILIDGPCEAELEKVLAYDFGRKYPSLDADARSACIAECRRLAERIEASCTEAERASLPRCRDRDDQIFLEAALAGRADALVTRDKALLACGRRALPFRILLPETLESENLKSGTDHD